MSEFKCYQERKIPNFTKTADDQYYKPIVNDHPEIQGVRNQLKLIKTSKQQSENIDNQMKEISKEITILNERVEDIGYHKKDPVYASKPFGSKLKTFQNDPSDTSQSTQSSTNYYGFNQNKPKQSLQEYVPLKNRIIVTEKKEYTQSNQVGLQLPDFYEKSDTVTPEQQIVNSKPLQQKQQTPENLTYQSPVEAIQKQTPTKEESPENPYMPSMKQQVQQKRQALPGSKNLVDEKPAVAVKSVEEQLQEAELQQVEDDNLIVCPEGCGRSFKSDVIEKHIKVCKAVFQSKRREFNSKSHRIVNQEQQKLARQGQIKEKQQQKQNMQKTGSKWKEQSQQLRNVAQKVIIFFLFNYKKKDQQFDENENEVD